MAILRGLCTIAEVEKYTRPPKSYSTLTKPTLAQVEDTVDKAIDFIYGKCDGEGIITPVVEIKTRRLIADLNAIYTGVLVEMELHQATHPNDNVISKSLKDKFDEKWADLINKTLLDSTATNDYRKIVPFDTAIWSKSCDIWDTAEEDDNTDRQAWFKSTKEW